MAWTAILTASLAYIAILAASLAAITTLAASLAALFWHYQLGVILAALLIQGSAINSNLAQNNLKLKDDLLVFKPKHITRTRTCVVYKYGGKTGIIDPCIQALAAKRCTAPLVRRTNVVHVCAFASDFRSFPSFSKFLNNVLHKERLVCFPIAHVFRLEKLGEKLFVARGQYRTVGEKRLIAGHSFRYI